MALTGNMSWMLLVLIGTFVGVYYLHKQGKLSWLKIKLPSIPRMLEPKAGTQIERLRAATEREVARAEELRSVLEAKRELAKARAENIRLMREIGGVSEKSVEKGKRDEQKAQEAEIEARKVKPRRL